MIDRALGLGLFAAGVACLGACGTDPYAPGTQLGTFHVKAELVTNGCGATLAPPNPWEFDVKLGRDPGKLYWIQGDVPVSGTLAPNAHATLTASTSQTVSGGDAGGPTCVLARNDAVTAILFTDPTNASEVSGFTGTLTYAFSEAAGSTGCATQLEDNGGALAALPCSLEYAMSGTRTALPNAYGK
jgi:hypothetical protein